MKILNLYAGLGGNRKRWDGCEVVAVEQNQEIASVYADMHPCDTVIVADAHDYLIKHYHDFDFVWSSPPCITHSSVREIGAKGGRYQPLFPDPRLWQEITFLRHFCKKSWVIENVRPYYMPPVRPDFTWCRNCFWTNLPLFNFSSVTQHSQRKHNDICGGSEVYGVKLDKYSITNKRQLLRNLVDPEIGAYIYSVALKYFEVNGGAMKRNQRGGISAAASLERQLL